MKLLIELPTWLGDAVMATPAIENIISNFKNVEITLIGSLVSVEALQNHPRVIQTYFVDKRFNNFYKTLSDLDEFDLFFSFRGSLRAKLFKLFVSSKVKNQYSKDKYKRGHQVEKYNNFINDSLGIDSKPGRLIVHSKGQKKINKNRILGINPGAAFGNAKQWYPENFAKVALGLSTEYDIIIFGGPQDYDIAQDIESYLIEMGVVNYLNLATKLSVTQLISQIENLDLLVTCDSGPMHLAAALNIPTVAIFGPTKVKETSQWMNEKSIVVKKNFECQPCMKKTCPLKHHNCMKLIDESDILDAAKNFN
ncbi:glycosyltransferase family 9 protein [Candidatus Thioglobus sp.]|nr:glycosyltransferase family 9 protein [Candidatus Thioglobus sp.]